MKKLGIALAIAIAAVGVAHAADLPTTKEPPAAPPVNCFASIWTWLELDAGRLSAELGPLHRLRDARRGAYLRVKRRPLQREVEQRRRQFHPKAELRREVALVAEQSQPVGRRHQDEPAASVLVGSVLVGLVDRRRLGMGIQSLLRVPRRGSAIASEPKRQGVALAGRGRRLEPHRPARQLASVHRRQQHDIWHLDRRPRQHAVARRDQLLRSDGRLLRLLTARFLRLLRRLRRHRGGARQHCRQVPVGFRSVYGANFRVAGLVQWGGYDQGNGTDGMYQGQVGGDFNLFGGAPYAGTLSMDAIGSWAKDAVNLSTFTGTCATLTKGPFAGQTGCTSGLPMFYANTDLKATLSNNTGFLFTAKYKWQAWTVYGGYAWLKQADPSDTFPNGFRTIGGWNVPATIPSTFPDASEILADAMDQLHDLRHSEDRSLFLGRG